MKRSGGMIDQARCLALTLQEAAGTLLDWNSPREKTHRRTRLRPTSVISVGKPPPGRDEHGAALARSGHA
jgi:hypothetical protein